MNYLREFLYRPKRSDTSLMARFFRADENLTAVAQELDSFDGRKDPERCASLVNKLRSCQDKLLSICNKMLEEVEPGYSSRLREHRAKFPDDMMTDNLAGQLWFGAECLAAGSSIMNKESESEAMRPLAKAVTKSLEKVRSLLREQVLSINQDYTEKIRENLKIFDRLFAEFEYNYVSCMVHVKSVKEYDLHQDLIVLFSDTLTRALKQEMVSQETVDNYDPSLMFAIPRLAIVYGLLICVEGPLNVDRSHSDFPSLFLPFKNLLRKIRELLQTLEPSEVLVLEMLLCQLEEPANISTKLKEVERMLENKEKSEGQAAKLQAKLSGEQAEPSKIQRLNSIPCQCDTNSSSSSSNSQTEQMVRDLLRDMVDDALNRVLQTSEPSNPASSAPESSGNTVEIDCTHPEIRVSPAHRRTVEIDIVPATNPVHSSPVPVTSSSASTDSRNVVKMRRNPSSEEASPPSRGGGCTSAPIAFRSSSSGLKRHNARRDAKRVPYKFQKDRRAKFKSTEDLIHRLYVCISGAADQLQSNYAADFRSILRVVFTINVTPDDIPDGPEPGTSGLGQNPDLSPVDDPENPDLEETEVDGDISFSSPPPEGAEHQSEAASLLPVGSRNRKSDDQTGCDESGGASALEEDPMPRLHAGVLGAQGSMDYGTDALQNEMSNSLYNLNLSGDGNSNDDESNGETTKGLGVYAQNIDLHLHAADGASGETPGALNLDGHSNNEFFQPEPALLDIADGTNSSNLPQEIVAPDNNFYRAVEQNPRQTPPSWVPDADAQHCMGCHEQFTFVKRRHHCRACGKVFCSKCSSHFMALPQFGLDRPVRVCNRCDLLMNGTYNLSNHATSPTGTGSSSDNGPEMATSPTSGNRSPTQWNRYYGMVS